VHSSESSAVTDLLQRLKVRYTILLVEHDMDAVITLADRITVLVYGQALFTGTPDEIRAHPEVRAIYLREDLTTLATFCNRPTSLHVLHSDQAG